MDDATSKFRKIYTRSFEYLHFFFSPKVIDRNEYMYNKYSDKKSNHISIYIFFNFGKLQIIYFMKFTGRQIQGRGDSLSLAYLWRFSYCFYPSIYILFYLSVSISIFIDIY